jgi:transglutaminase/protease-like cytokinesis protein 3
MQIELHYQLRIEFSNPVRDHQYLLRLVPRMDAYQQVQVQIQVEGKAFDLNRLCRDGWGNLLIAGQHLASHSQFNVELTALLGHPLTTHPCGLAPNVFLPLTDITRLTSEEASAWLGAIDLKQEDKTALAIAVMQAVFSQMHFERGQTTVHHPVREVIMQRQGVCQDYAHLLIALLRHCQIPARYVAGVAEGEGESHAWVEAWTGQTWLALDPTHNQQISDNLPYIAFSIGRDSSDCPLNSGSFTGIAQQTLSVQAKVTSTTN